MRKLIYIAALLVYFFTSGGIVYGQNQSNENVSEIEKTTNAAIKTIKKEESLSEADKTKFIKRLQVLSHSATTNKNVANNFAKEYKRIADNYNRITNKTLPSVETEKNEK